MIAWRSVGLMAFFVTALTATTLLAEPTATPSDRTWLRQTPNRHSVASAPSQLSLGKWAALALVVGFAGFAVWKRRQTRRSSPVAAASQIRIAGVTKLSPKAQLIVATVNGRSMLLGVTDASVNRLMWLDGIGDEADDEDDAGAERDSSHDEPALQGADDIYPNQTVTRRMASSANRGKAPASVTENAQTRRQPSKFRELLADAIGLSPKAAASRADVTLKAPVDQLVAATADRYLGRDTRRMNTARLGQRNAPSGPLIDVEGQAAGLVARLNRSRL